MALVAVHGKSVVGVMLTHPQVGPFHGRGAVKALRLLTPCKEEFQLIDSITREVVGESTNGVLQVSQEVRERSFAATQLPYAQYGIGPDSGYVNLSAWRRLCVVMSTISDENSEYEFEQEWSQLFENNKPLPRFVHNLPAPVAEETQYVPAVNYDFAKDFKKDAVTGSSETAVQ